MLEQFSGTFHFQHLFCHFTPILFHLLSFSFSTYAFGLYSANTLSPQQSVPMYDIDLSMNRTKAPLSTIPV